MQYIVIGTLIVNINTVYRPNVMTNCKIGGFQTHIEFILKKFEIIKLIRIRRRVHVHTK